MHGDIPTLGGLSHSQTREALSPNPHLKAVAATVGNLNLVPVSVRVLRGPASA